MKSGSLQSGAVEIGAVVVANSELRARYVRPDVGRRSIGSAFVRELEQIACRQGLSELILDSSITAERAHMDRENKELFHAALSVLKARDWTLLGERLSGYDDPLFGPDPTAGLKLLRRLLTQDESR